MHSGKFDTGSIQLFPCVLSSLSEFQTVELWQRNPQVAGATADALTTPWLRTA